MSVADFTTDGQDLVVCQRCKETFPPNTLLFYMHDRRPDRPGKKICTGCRQYQLNKTETRQRTEQRTECTSYNTYLRERDSYYHVVPSENRQDIRKQVNAAQRQGKCKSPSFSSAPLCEIELGESHPIRIGDHKVGWTSGPPNNENMLPPPAPDSGSSTQNSSRRAPWPMQKTGKDRSSGPRVSTPGGAQFATMVNIPEFFSNIGNLKPGYQEAHSRYDEMRHYFAHQAYATSNGQTVNVKFTMMWMKPGNKNPAVVSVSAIKHALKITTQYKRLESI